MDNGSEDGETPAIASSSKEDSDFSLEGEFQEDDLESSLLLSGAQRKSSSHSRIASDLDQEGPEDPDGLEFEYEPGISLGSLEFGQRSEEPCWPENCLFCGVDYETGKSFLFSIITSGLTTKV